MLRISSSPSSSCSEDPGDTIVVEEASYYALPPSALNCTGGPMGPVRAAPPEDATAADGGDNFSDPLRQNFFPQLLGLPRMSRDLRQALNRRCSGLGKGQVKGLFKKELKIPVVCLQYRVSLQSMLRLFNCYSDLL